MRVVKCKRSRRWPSPAGFAPRLLRPQCATFMRKAFVIQRKTLPIALLRECFTPDFDLGTLTWKRRPDSHFPDLRVAKMWNTKYAGKPAGSRRGGNMFRVEINHSDFLVHRIVWTLANGSWPENEIDHIDGNPANNALVNLRDVPHHINLGNQKLNSKNTSGVPGVYMNRHGKWCAQMKVNQKTWHLGSFCTLAEAAAVRKEAEVLHDFHQNHGRTQ